MSNSISIDFHNQTGYFSPGSVVAGNVTVFLSNPKKSRNITLHTFGNAKTAFVTETSQKCSFEKKFFDYNLILWKAVKNDDEMISAGKHCFKFSFEIPESCLPNFEGKFGHVRYKIIAKMHISNQFNLVKEEYFFVISPLNFPIKKTPVKRNFSSNGINIEVFMPREDYSCDEIISLLITIKNDSKFSIETIETGIKTRICYKGTKKAEKKEESYQLTDYENTFSLSLNDNIFSLPGDTDNYKRDLQLTGLYPTIFNDIIDIRHFLYVKLVTKQVFSSTSVVPIMLYSAHNQIDPSAPSLENLTLNNDLSINNNPNLSSTSNFQDVSAENAFANIFGVPPPAYDEINNTEMFSFSNLSPYSSPSANNQNGKIKDERL